MKLNLDYALKVGLIESVYSLHTFNPKKKKKKLTVIYVKIACEKKIYISTPRKEGFILWLATFCNSFSASKLYDYYGGFSQDETYSSKKLNQLLHPHLNQEQKHPSIPFTTNVCLHCHLGHTDQMPSPFSFFTTCNV
jgi:hypothetical protein